MRATVLKAFVIICAGSAGALIAAPAGAAAWAETRIVSTTSKGETKIQSSTYREAREGSLIRVVEEAEDGRVETLLAADGTVVSTEIQAKQGTLRMTSDGAAVELGGTWEGKPVSGRCELKGLGFYGNGFAFALRALARNGLSSLEFPMISPSKPASPTVMELKREGAAAFKGKSAIKVKLTLAGAMSVFWSARFLIGEDGTFYRFEGNQGPGTPSMVTELVEVKE